MLSGKRYFPYPYGPVIQFRELPIDQPRNVSLPVWFMKCSELSSWKPDGTEKSETEAEGNDVNA
ncbi:MAG: hypothetical protein DU480_05070 [Nitrosomonas sp.]